MPDPPPTTTMSVTVVAGKYMLNGAQEPSFHVPAGLTIIFNLDDPSNNYHPFKLSTSPDGSHAGGVEYTGIIKSAGYDAAFGGTQVRSLTFMAPTDCHQAVYYYCQSHRIMGGGICVEDVCSLSD